MYTPTIEDYELSFAIAHKHGLHDYDTIVEAFVIACKKSKNHDEFKRKVFAWLKFFKLRGNPKKEILFSELEGFDPVGYTLEKDKEKLELTKLLNKIGIKHVEDPIEDFLIWVEREYGLVAKTLMEKYLEGRKFTEIAQEMGLSKKTLEKLFNQIIRRLSNV